MQFGFLKFFLLAVVILVAGGVGWLAMTDMPVAQKEITLTIPTDSLGKN